MKRRFRIIFKVGPVPNTGGELNPLRWKIELRDNITSWKRGKIGLVHSAVRRVASYFDAYELKHWSNNCGWGFVAFIITQRYFHEEKGYGYLRG